MDKCPLLGLNMQDREWAHKAKQTDCLKEKCAWWFGAEECCAIVAMANSLYKELEL